jgi:hypothetical protein
VPCAAVAGPSYGCDMAMEGERRLRSRRTAEIVRRELARGGLDFAFRAMTSAVADFRHTSPENREDFLMCPESAGSARWETLLAAVVGRECDRFGIPRPPWTRPEPLAEEWVVTTLPAPSKQWLARIRAGTPEEFSRLNLWVHARTWKSYRSPRPLKLRRDRARLGGMVGPDDVVARVTGAAGPEDSPDPRARHAPTGSPSKRGRAPLGAAEPRAYDVVQRDRPAAKTNRPLRYGSATNALSAQSPWAPRASGPR